MGWTTDPGTYPSYIGNKQSILNDLPGRTDVANGADWNSHDNEIMAHQGVLVNHEGRINYIESEHIRSILFKTSNYTIQANDSFILASGMTTTITLPTAINCQGQVYTIKRIGTSNITINTTSSQTIDGELTCILDYINMSIDVISDNSNWRII